MNPKRLLFYVPLACMLLFIVLFQMAANRYPCYGMCDEHYSWNKTYWCNLLSYKTSSGIINEARYWSYGAWICLCAGISVFWYRLSYILEKGKRKWIAISGIGCLSMALFIGTPAHDPIILFAGLLGFTAMAKTVYECRQPYPTLFFLGLFCMFLSSLNYFMYYTGIWIGELAWFQKVSFIIYFVWFALAIIQIRQVEN